MRIANLSGRLVLLRDELAVDVGRASGGRFGPDPQAIYPRWVKFADWAGNADLPAGVAFDPAELGSPAPAPDQVFAIGLNFDEHAIEAGFVTPETEPPVFTKFLSSITGPYHDVVIPDGGKVDWEVELVVVIGHTAERVSAKDARSHVAALAVGQDISERGLQTAAAPPRFSLAKSYANFGPIGPCLVSVDEFEDPDDRCGPVT